MNNAPVVQVSEHHTADIVMLKNKNVGISFADTLHYFFQFESNYVTDSTFHSYTNSIIQRVELLDSFEQLGHDLPAYFLTYFPIVDQLC